MGDSCDKGRVWVVVGECGQNRDQKRCNTSRNRRIRWLLLMVAAIIPIVLISFLLTNLNVINLWRKDWTVVSTFPDSSLAIAETTHLSSCEAIPFRTSDILEADERDIFKGVRTSFLPPELAVIPPNCITSAGAPLSDADDDPESGLPLVDSIVVDPQQPIAQLLNYLGLRKRRHVIADDLINQEGVSPTTSIIADVDVDYRDDTSTANMRTTTTASVLSRAKTSTMPTTTTHRYSPDEDVEALAMNSFWTEVSDFETVRLAQSLMMQKYMDLTVDPCEDFYQYACGNWEKLNPIPKDKAAYDTFEMLRESLDLVLKGLLEESTNDTTGNSDTAASEFSGQLSNETSESVDVEERNVNGANVSAEMKAINLYKSCISYGILERRGIQPLLELLDSLGGWPVLDAHWDETGFDWLKLTAQLRLFNNDIFIVEWVGPDIKYSQENIIQFDQTSLGLPTRDYFLQSSNSEYLAAYQVYMAEVIHLLNVDATVAKETAWEIVEFEKQLAKITKTPEERSNVTLLYRRMSVGVLHTLVPGIDWTEYLKIVLMRDVNPSEKIVMFATDFMQDLVKLIDRTDKRTIANYLFWRFVRHRVNNLDDRFQDAKQRFYFVLFGREQSPPRWKMCVHQVNSNLGMALGARFVRKFFDELSKQDTLTMTHDLQEAFREILNNTDWIDNTTKTLAEDKVNAMSLRIGYPDYILSKEELNDKYSDLVIHPDRYFENTLNVLKHMTRQEHDKLTEIVNKTSWHTAPAVVNAYYSRNKNQIIFPAGILQPPFYHKYFPKSLNYGGIGNYISMY